MNKKPKFSIIIPLYNKEKYIKRAIKSVLNQEFKNFELIVVCDPSTDRSSKIIKKFTDNRINIFYRKVAGCGGYAARNLGIKKAKADWIAFLDADDQWEINHLKISYDLIKKNKFSKFIAAGYKKIDSNNQKIYGFMSKNKKFKYVNFFEFLTFSPFYTSTVVIKKNLLLSIRGFPENKMKRGGDVETWYKAIEQAGGYILSSHIGAKYFVNSENMVTRQTFFTKLEIQNITIKKFIKKYKGTKLEPELIKKFNSQVLYAWNQNMQLGIKKNFNLRNHLLPQAFNMKLFFYLILSYLPNLILKILYKFLLKIVSLKRNFV